MKKVLSFVLKLALALGLMLMSFVGIAHANFGTVCQPDGRPAVQLEGWTPYANGEVGIAAKDQAGKQTQAMGKLDEKGNGTFPFGEPGVLYPIVLVRIASGGRSNYLDFANVKCDPPQATLQSILEDPKRNWGRIQDVITGWLTHWF